jgi:nucleotide-binding universal stress UspA family protein
MEIIVKVLAALNVTHAGDASLAYAIDFAREGDGELVVLGVVEPRLDPPQPAYGERVRRYRQTELAVARAVAQARESGLVAEGGIRYGNVGVEALREAEARDAEHAFVPTASAALFRKRASVEHIVLPTRLPAEDPSCSRRSVLGRQRSGIRVRDEPPRRGSRTRLLGLAHECSGIGSSIMRSIGRPPVRAQAWFAPARPAVG